ncbi:MAG TPA: universal stress protein [Candidatus Bathyarchaeia archaeon]|nr:universal stress protein [Candidatus Bathyarchaeia archaeon]
MPARGGSTTKRILVPITQGSTADHALTVINAARIARKSGGVVRLAYLAPLPSPRVDHHDRVVADTDREMARIAAGAREHLESLAAGMEGVPVEIVVRFGRPGRELAIEACAFEADLIALAAPTGPRLRGRIRAWQLRRMAQGLEIPLIVFPLPASGAGTRSGGALAAPAVR